MPAEDNPLDPVRTSDFDYELPPELIAQTPIEPRDASRLLVVDRASGAIAHSRFASIVELLRPGDLLVLNDSRVIAARLRGNRLPTGGAVEALLVRERAPGRWEALLKPGKRIAEGQRLLFSRAGVTVEATAEQWLEDGLCLLAFDPMAIPRDLGAMPLPPYIRAQLHDPERYQTVYAQELGSAAAPTAGLHFTQRLLGELRSAGVETAFLTLHVGPATFRPVHVDDARRHPMHAEFFHLDSAAADAINTARQKRRRVIAVGTTSVRVLEQLGSYMRDTEVRPTEGWTRLLILPGHRYRLVDALLTNFHLPRSTLLMLVAAFMGRELMMRAYREAIRERYRFYSFGDAMLIV
ncbi:MAG TPA: tRNA preQ1(34) S-adenosylmethionine ribosyltransferase-isomerase QueA [Dehalococcoidia bacterium]|nr:tRNA preQ1(34) S-adenosylmethionine ribosyltransferase-isomerase QueA [Dehalococcoidia bacterium]